MEASLADVNGIRLGYEKFGQGQPLVLHGGFGTLDMFGPNVGLLAKTRRVIGVDLQSHGRSPATDRPMRFETMADPTKWLAGGDPLASGSHLGDHAGSAACSATKRAARPAATVFPFVS